MVRSCAYKTEISPNNKQRTLLEKSAGVARFVYNLGLEVDFIERMLNNVNA